MGIVGEVFDQEVRKQIEYREGLLRNAGNSTHSRNFLEFQNSTSWLRLASAVDIKEPDASQITPSRKEEFEKRVAELTQRYGVTPGSELSRNIVLYGGTQKFNPPVNDNTSGNFTKKQGINTSGTLL